MDRVNEDIFCLLCFYLMVIGWSKSNKGETYNAFLYVDEKNNIISLYGQITMGLLSLEQTKFKQCYSFEGVHIIMPIFVRTGD